MLNRPAAALISGLLAVALLAGCSANPVTGEKELTLFSTEFEIETGQTHFVPGQQAGGGLYTADPQVASYVASVGARVAAVSDRDLPYEFVVLNSSVPNAWALPGGKIAVNRGLLMELESEAELATVLGHEIVHAAARHSTQALNRGLLFNIATLAAALGGMDPDAASQLIGVGAVAFGLINQGYSREAEREADYHGMRYLRAAGYDTSAAVSLQEKFLKLSKGRDRGWLAGLFASHPPSVDRLAGNRTALSEFPPGGEAGRERYEEALSVLRSRALAYEAGDEARSLLAMRPGESLARIREAIAREPRESLFHGIKGQALARQGRLPGAVEAYGAAIALGPAYWEHYLGLGLAHEALGNRTEAGSNLRASLRLLPTAAGNLALGMLALEDGRRDEAKGFFQAARKAEGSLGVAAEREFILLDIPDAPWRHIAVEILVRSGRVALRVRNRTDYELRDVVVRLDAEINGQMLRRWIRPRKLGARSTIVLDGQLRFAEEDEVTLGTRVVQAQPIFARASGWRPYKPYP